MDGSPPTLFRFTADGVDLEFSGSEAFVEAQIARFRGFLERSIGKEGAGPAPSGAPVTAMASTPSVAGASEATAPMAAGPKQTLDEFYAARPLREGRGAIQDRILLFIHFLHTVQGKREVSGDDILWCFQQLSLERPKNLHNALGILKRKLGHLEEGSRRGLYSLSPAGRNYVEGRFR